MKSKIYFTVKCIVSFLLLYWLIQKGDLSYRNVKIAFSNIWLVSIFLMLTFTQLYIGAVRTNILMQFRTNKDLALKRVLLITWASSFINCIAPSALFGEIFKLKELLTVDPDLNKDNTFYTIGFSKIFSIISLLLITVVSSLMVKEQPKEIQPFIDLLYLTFALLLCFYMVRNPIISMLRPIFRKLYSKINSVKIQQRFDNYREYHFSFLEDRKYFFLVIFLSIVLQALNTISFLLIIYSINPNPDQNILAVTFVIPLGIMAMTLPISISGLGVGHLAFSKLIGMFGISNGADVFTIYFAYSYIFNMLGAVSFILLQRKKHDPLINY